MAVNFASASSQYVKNAAPSLPPLVSTGYPCTMACWFNPTTLVSGGLFGFYDTATTNNVLQGSTSALGSMSIDAQAGGSITQAATAGHMTTGTWNFVIARFLSATSRRLAVLFSGGTIENIQGTFSAAPAGLDTIGVGAKVVSTPTTFQNGLIGEFWYTDTDIQPDGAVLSDNLLWQLAYGGPFSVSSVVKDIVEYRSLRDAVTSDQDNGTETFSRVGPQTWTQSGTPTLGIHPPLPYWYVKPRQTPRILTV